MRKKEDVGTVIVSDRLMVCGAETYDSIGWDGIRTVMVGVGVRVR